jgi:acetoin utilization deacetylase AcuC-like enzyme
MQVTILYYSDDRFLLHENFPGHPERPDRLRAVAAGVEASLARTVPVAPVPATNEELALVHSTSYVHEIEEFCRTGGGRLDADTGTVPESWEAARLAAGAGLDALYRLRQGEADAAFLNIRPPGHHAERAAAMGFCIFNNAGLVAARIVAGGERVVIVDWDVHHGNGTQKTFYREPRVLYLSLHQYPAYPGTGWHDERGTGEALGTTVNLPMLPGTGGDLYQAAFDVLAPRIQGFEPDWLIISAGYDAHRDDPLADLRLVSADYGAMASILHGLVPAGRTLALLEGGYNLEALTDSVEATLNGLSGMDFAFADHESPPAAWLLFREAVASMVQGGT